MRSLVVTLGRFLAFALVLLFAGLSLHAQSNTGAIAGSILDSSGAVVQGASITATGVETGTVYTTTSTATGAYRIPDMRVGAYNVTVNAPGFKVSQQARSTPPRLWTSRCNPAM